MTSPGLGKYSSPQSTKRPGIGMPNEPVKSYGKLNIRDRPPENPSVGHASRGLVFRAASPTPALLLPTHSTGINSVDSVSAIGHAL